MADPLFDIFAQAILRGAAAVLSVPDEQGLRHLKTRFLGQDDEGFYLEAIRGERELIDSLIAAAQPAGVSFRGGLARAALTSRILRYIKDFPLNDGVVLPALLMEFPDSIQPIQRRIHYRVHVTRDAGLRVRIWRIPEHAYIKDRPMSAQEVGCAVKNISVGGIGITVLPRPDRPLHLGRNDRLRIEVVYGGIDLLIEGRVRHPEQMPRDQSAGVHVGIQFAKLEDKLEGRQTQAALTTIVGELQRDEVRRNKLGIASA